MPPQHELQTYSSVLAVRAFSNLYTQRSRPSDRRRQVEHIGFTPSHLDLRSRHGSQASEILRRFCLPLAWAIMLEMDGFCE